MAKFYLSLGVGQDLDLYAERSPEAGPYALTQLPGGDKVVAFSAVPDPPSRLDVYGRRTDGSVAHWHTDDAGATWQGPEELGGVYVLGPFGVTLSL